MNTQEIAQLADTMIKSKPSKEKAFKTLLDVAKYIEDDEMLMEMASLYKFFSPSSSKKPKSRFEWAALAMAKKDVRYYLNYAYVDDENIVGTDGHRLHLSANSGSHLANGFYDNAGMLLNGTEWANYPKYERLLVNCESWPQVNVEDFKAGMVEKGSKVTSTMFVEIDCVETHLNKKYFDEMLCNPEGVPDIYISETRQAIFKWPSNGDTGIIMAMKAK